MTSKDRTELRRILKARFELLNKQLSVREQELRTQIAEEIRKDHAKAVKDGQKKIAKLVEKAQKLEAEATTLQQELENSGVGPRGYRRHDYSQLMSINWDDRLEPIDITEKINIAYQKLVAAAGLHKLDLGLKQLELEEELAIGALGSDEAKSFLGKIPSLNTLIPPNVDVKAAISAVAEDIEDTDSDGTKLS